MSQASAGVAAVHRAPEVQIPTPRVSETPEQLPPRTSTEHFVASPRSHGPPQNCGLAPSTGDGDATGQLATIGGTAATGVLSDHLHSWSGSPGRFGAKQVEAGTHSPLIEPTGTMHAVPSTQGDSIAPAAYMSFDPSTSSVVHSPLREIPTQMPSADMHMPPWHTGEHPYSHRE